MRNWTDKQDATAYEIFSTISELHGMDRAVDLLNDAREAFGLGFGDTDIEAWVARFQGEN